MSVLYSPTVSEFILARSWPDTVTREDVLRVARENGIKLTNGRLDPDRLIGIKGMSGLVEDDARQRARRTREDAERKERDATRTEMESAGDALAKSLGKE